MPALLTRATAKDLHAFNAAAEVIQQTCFEGWKKITKVTPTSIAHQARARWKAGKSVYTPVFSVRLGVSSEGHFSPTFNASGSGDKSREGKARLPKDTASRGPQIKIMICKDPP